VERWWAIAMMEPPAAFIGPSSLLAFQRPFSRASRVRYECETLFRTACIIIITVVACMFRRTQPSSGDHGLAHTKGAADC